MRQVTATEPGGVAVYLLGLMAWFRGNCLGPLWQDTHSGDQMKTVLAATALVVVLAGCENRARDTGRVESVDTNVTTRSTQDTTIIRSETETDTTVKEGELKRDTATSR